MKSFFVLLTACITALHAFEINQIEGISGSISQAAFDNEANLYVLTLNGLLYKLDSEKNILWHLDLSSFRNVSFSCDFLFNKQNDVYMGCDVGSKIDDLVSTLAVIRANTTNLEVLGGLSTGYGFGQVLLDEEDNLFYYDRQQTEYNTLRMIKSNGHGPVVIGGLQNLLITEIFQDNKGNIYGNGYSSNSVSKFFVITKDAKHDEVPEAEIIELLDDEHTGFVLNTLVDSENNIFISLYVDENNGIIKKLSNGTLTTILKTPNYENLLGLHLEEKIIVASWSLSNNDCGFSYYNKSDGSFKPIQLSEPGRDWRSCRYLKYQADEFENVYIGSVYQLGNSSLEYLHHDKLETVGVNFENGPIQVYNMTLDINDNLWTFEFAENVFRIEKGSIDAIKVDYFEGLKPRSMIRNPITKEIVVVCEEGVHYISV